MLVVSIYSLGSGGRSVGVPFFLPQTPDYVEEEQKQQSPNKRVKERQKDLKRLWEPFAVRVNQQARV